MTTAQTNITKKTWTSPQMAAFTASLIQGAAALKADEDFIPLQKAAPAKKVMRVIPGYKAAPRIGLGRFAFYCVLMVVMLPLFLLTGRSATR